jgi:hypothetical protein
MRCLNCTKNEKRTGRSFFKKGGCGQKRTGRQGGVKGQNLKNERPFAFRKSKNERPFAFQKPGLRGWQVGSGERKKNVGGRGVGKYKVRRFLRAATYADLMDYARGYLCDVIDAEINMFCNDF